LRKCGDYDQRSGYHETTRPPVRNAITGAAMSNRVVTYTDFGLNSVEEYWEKIVAPGVREFQSAPSPCSTYQAAHSVWHLHNWVWHDRNPGKDSRGAAFNNYRAKLLADCPELGWLRDVADARKHRGLGRLPEVQGAGPRYVGRGFLPAELLSPGKGVLKFFLVLSDGSKEDMDEVLRNAIVFWQAELKPRDLADPFI
jgi:hypothetical protein